MKDFEKYALYEKLISKPLESKFCISFLKDDLYRSTFIADYNYFLLDKNESIYKDFIHDNLTSNSIDLVSDLLILATRINYFSNTIMNKIKTILFKNSNHILKLASFDYLNMFYHNLSKENYIAYSHSVRAKSTIKLVVFQSLINLLLEDKKKYFNQILEILMNSIVPVFFYRLANNLLEFEHFRNELESDDIESLFYALNYQGFDKEVVNEINDDLISIRKVVC
jgi:hypothetical protein